MTAKYFTIVSMILFFAAKGIAQTNKTEQHRLVAIRMIGHEILLSSGDSSSRVLPVVKEKGRYKIEFDSSFHFYPGELVSSINNIILKAQIAKHYIVEVEGCESKEIIYNYEHGNTSKHDIIPCAPRFQPTACYVIFISIFDPAPISKADQSTANSNLLNSSTISLAIAALLILLALYRFYRSKNPQKTANPNLITLGNYQFDRLNSELLLDDQRLELSAKESDLLFLLYQSKNATLGRDEILNNVWGDEGDYVGRTLDVFISKLRKRLEFDSKIKIVNIRGVGYKLVLNS